MEDLLDDHQEEIQLTDREVFTKIWTSPRIVFKYIVDNNYDKYVIFLLLLAGISRAFDRAASNNSGDSMSIWAIIGLCTILGGLFGWISFYIYAWLLAWTGRWLKGQGETSSILNILAYAMLPSLFVLIILIAQMAVYGNEIFSSTPDFSTDSLMGTAFLYFSVFLDIILGAWTIVLCIIGIAAVQKISIWKSILNLLLPLLIFLIPIFLFSLL